MLWLQRLNLLIWEISINKVAFAWLLPAQNFITECQWITENMIFYTSGHWYKIKAKPLPECAMWCPATQTKRLVSRRQFCFIRNEHRREIQPTSIIKGVKRKSGMMPKVKETSEPSDRDIHKNVLLNFSHHTHAMKSQIDWLPYLKASV